MTKKRIMKFKLTALGLLAAVLGMAAADSAVAAPVTTGSAELQLSSQATKRLKNHKIQVVGVNAVRLSGTNRFGFAGTGGNLTVQTNTPGPYDPVVVTGVDGSMTLRGRLRFTHWKWVRRHNGRRVKRQFRTVLMGFKVNLDQDMLRGQFGKNKSDWRLMSMDSSALVYGGTPVAPTVSNIKLTLMPKAIQRLNRNIGVARVFNNISVFGTMSMSAQLAAS